MAKAGAMGIVVPPRWKSGWRRSWRTSRCCAPRRERRTTWPVLRTVVGAVGTFSDLDFDAVADLRLAVDEACTRLIRSATPGATLVVVVDPREEVVVVEASTNCDTSDVVTEGSFSWHVLSSLTDDLQTFHNGHDSTPDGLVFGITLTTRRAGAPR